MSKKDLIAFLSTVKKYLKKDLKNRNSCAIVYCVMNPGVAQLGARLTGGQEAVSSSLATRTIN